MARNGIHLPNRYVLSRTFYTVTDKDRSHGTAW
jgi:hypothetical protein